MTWSYSTSNSIDTTKLYSFLINAPKYVKVLNYCAFSDIIIMLRILILYQFKFAFGKTQALVIILELV